MSDVILDIGITYWKFSRLILMLYDDISSDYDFYLEKPSISYNFYYSDKERGFSISFKELTMIPRIGESVHIPFFEARTRYRNFHVKNITHHFYNDTHMVDIDLEQGDYNLFWQFRRDEAILNEQINIFDRLKLSEEEIMKKLGF